MWDKQHCLNDAAMIVVACLELMPTSLRCFIFLLQREGDDANFRASMSRTGTVTATMSSSETYPFFAPPSVLQVTRWHSVLYATLTKRMYKRENVSVQFKLLRRGGGGGDKTKPWCAPPSASLLTWTRHAPRLPRLSPGNGEIILETRFPQRRMFKHSAIC